MSEIPEEIPSQPQDATLPEETSAGEGLTTRETVPETAETSAVVVVPIADPAPRNAADAPLLFQSFPRLIPPPQERIPHMGHIGILMLLALGCLAVAAL